MRELYNVRVLPGEDVDGDGGGAGDGDGCASPATPLTADEERRYRGLLFTELGNEIADRGWARHPAYTPEDRRRLVDVAERLTAHWGQRVFVEAEDLTRLRLCLASHRTP